MAGETDLLTKLQNCTALTKPVIWHTGAYVDNLAYADDKTSRTGDSTWEIGTLADMQTYYDELVRITGIMPLHEYDGESGAGATQLATKEGDFPSSGAEYALWLDPFDIAGTGIADYAYAGLDAMWDSTKIFSAVLEIMWDRIQRLCHLPIKYVHCSYNGWAGTGYTAAEKAVRYQRYEWADDRIHAAFPDATVIWYGGAPVQSLWTIGLQDESPNFRYGEDSLYEDIGDYYNFTAEYPWNSHHTAHPWDFGTDFCNTRGRDGWVTTAICYSKAAPALTDTSGITSTNQSSTWQVNGVEYPPMYDWRLGRMFGHFDEYYNGSQHPRCPLGTHGSATDRIQGITLLGSPFRANDENATYFKEWLLRFLTFCYAFNDEDTTGFDDIDDWDHTYTQNIEDYA